MTRGIEAMIILQMTARSILADLRLCWNVAKRDLGNRYASSVGGVFWTIGTPLLTALINVTVFSILMSGRMGKNYGDAPFLVFFFIPFSLWMIFAEAVPRATSIIREYAYLLKSQVGFPVWVIPLIPLASSVVTQLVILACCLIAMAFTGTGMANTAGLYLVLWLLTVLITVGVSYLVASLSVYLPDLAQVMPIVVNVLFWLTPMLYPPSLVEASGSGVARDVILRYNPFCFLAEGARMAVLGAPGPLWGNIATLALWGAGVLALGMYVYRSLRRGFADVI